MGLKKLTIISDTALYCIKNDYFGFGPVVKEIQFIEHMFDEIVWIGFERNDRINDLSMQKIQNNKIKFILLKNIGGKNIKSFLEILMYYPKIFFIIKKEIKNSHVIHSRAPSHPALISILISFFYKDKVWWNKYAGDWSQKKPSLSYGFQRWILKKAKHTKVTINGFWENQPSHCFSFENPCLTKVNIIEGKGVASVRKFNPPYTLCFIGRLEDVKGVPRIIEALKCIPNNLINDVHFIGNGKNMEYYKKELSFLGDKVIFHGFLDNTSIHFLLKKTDFILLPSDLEGFPKVVAEAACFGVIPVVSNAGSISHYVNNNNGFLWEINSNIGFTEILQKALQSDQEELNNMSKEILLLAEKFTFDRYLEKLNENILNKNIN